MNNVMLGILYLFSSLWEFFKENSFRYDNICSDHGEAKTNIPKYWLET